MDQTKKHFETCQNCAKIHWNLWNFVEMGSRVRSITFQKTNIITVSLYDFIRNVFIYFAGKFQNDTWSRNWETSLEVLKQWMFHTAFFEFKNEKHFISGSKKKRNDKGTPNGESDIRNFLRIFFRRIGEFRIISPKKKVGELSDG